MRSSVVFGLAFILVLAMYLFLPKKDVSKASSVENKSLRTLEAYRYEFINKQADSTKLILNELEVKLRDAKDSMASAMAYSEGIAIYNRLQAPEIAALLVFQKAKLIKNTNSWEMAGTNFLQLLSDPNLDTNLVSDIAKHSVESFENSVKLDSNNVGAKMKLAECYMQLSNKPMDGVQLLLGIVKQYPKNIEAQLLLAKFGIVSGQYEKVMQRLENVLSLEPQNTDALLMRAQVYASTEKYDLAAKDLGIVKSNKNTPESMKIQIETAIQDLKNKAKENPKN